MMSIQHRINSQQKQSETGRNVDLRMRFWVLTFDQSLQGLLSWTAVWFSTRASLQTSTNGRLLPSGRPQTYRGYGCASTHHQGTKKKQLSRECLRLRASLRVRFFFLSLGKLHKLRDEKLPLYDGDGDVGKKDEPGDRVHPPVEHVCHGDTNAQTSR